MNYYGWAPYVPVGERRAKAKKRMEKLRKKGQKILPIEIEGRTIASSVWGKLWCKHLEQFSDYENRLPRGRTYVRNGSVCHLDIQKKKVEAIVSGSSLYNVLIDIKPISTKHWKEVQRKCSGEIGSILELLQGKLSDGVMQVVSDPSKGLFPRPSEIELDCDCPDGATMCKHIAAVLYGVGARLDHNPELLFHLRDVKYHDLVPEKLDLISPKKGARRQPKGELSNLFGIELDESTPKGKSSPRKKTSEIAPPPPKRKRESQSVSVQEKSTKATKTIKDVAITPIKIETQNKETKQEKKNIKKLKNRQKLRSKRKILREKRSEFQKNNLRKS